MSSSFSLFDPTKSAIPEVLIPAEKKIARDYLYPDVPAELQVIFDANNKKWIAQAPRTDTWSSELHDCYIVGINESYAAAFKSFASPDLIYRRKQQMHSVEITQFANVWTSQLQRCQNRIQYDTVNRHFLTLVKYDPSFKESAAIIFKSQFLIDFRDNLTKEIDESNSSLKEGAAERTLANFVWLPKKSKGEARKPNLGKAGKVKIDLFVHNGQKWRQSKIDIYCCKDTIPEGKLEEGSSLVIAYYVETDVICVQKINLKTDTVSKTRYFTTKAKEQSPLIVASYGLVSDGFFVYHQDYELSIERSFITSLYKDKTNLYIGTNFGGIYKVASCGSVLESFEMSKDILYVLNVRPNLCQSMAAITHFGDKEDVTFNIDRPLCAVKKGTFIISIDKYGIVRCNMLIDRKGEIQFNPPPDLRILVEDVQPWYHDGIFMNNEGNVIRVIYPDGKIRTLKLN